MKIFRKLIIIVAILIIGIWFIGSVINYYTYYMGSDVFLVQKFDAHRVMNITTEKSNALNMTNLTEEEVRELIGYPENVTKITTDELKEYPALENALNGEDCIKSGSYSSLCKITPENSKKIEKFIDSKRNSTFSTCFKIDEMYGEDCYTFAFKRP
ncbi:MAG: hypothetical protein O8C62_04945 [Candidatus Methanoperedens sp.]|nr:hypothetical protein [Candidatus Methanoperedens sp.]